MTSYMERAERRSYDRSERLPFSSGIREFLAESRKCQTLYFNCEGAYDRRIFKKGDEDSLRDYIYNTIYYMGGNDFRLSDKGDAKSIKVESLQREIFTISNRFGFREETHVSVVWVYYHDFRSERTLSLPVFKIYMTESLENAVFLSLDLSYHDNWDSYLGNEPFPDAFLCVPRHGRYHFDDEEHKLDLEFVTSRKAPNRSGSSSTPSHISKWSCRSFSQNVVLPLIVRIKSFGNAVMVKIKLAVAALEALWNKHKNGIMRAFIFVVTVLVREFELLDKILPNSNILDSLRNISNYALMLLNFYGERQLMDNCVHETLNRSLVTSDEPSLTVDSELLGTQADEVKEFLLLLKEPKKNWKKILKRVCTVFRKNVSFLLRMLSFFEDFCPWPISISFSLLLLLLKILEESAFLNPPEEPAGEIEHGSFSRDTECNSLAPFVNQNELKGVSQMSGKKLLQALPNLLEDSARSIEQNTVTQKRKQKRCIMEREVDGFRIRFMLCPSIPELNNHIRHLLGIKISLKQKGQFYFHVIAPSGSIVGHLFFPQNFSVIGVFPKKIRPVRRKHKLNRQKLLRRNRVF